MTADVPPLEVWPRARDAAAHAVASGPDIAESQTARGMVSYWLDWDWPAAEAAYRKAVALDPSYALAHRMLGVLLGTDGRHEEARSCLRRARELDPLQPMMYALSAHVALLARDHSAGLEFARQATAVGPAFWIGFFQLAWAYERLGQVALALEALHRAEVSSGGNSKMLSLRGYILAKAGRRGEAEQVLSALETISHERYVPPYAFALIHVGLGHNERALDWLQHAYNVRDVHVIWLPMDPKLDPLRNEMSFVRLIERCGFRNSDTAKITSQG
jgi:tetratricopeptide (TPR) repeat protein